MYSMVYSYLNILHVVLQLADAGRALKDSSLESIKVKTVVHQRDYYQL